MKKILSIFLIIIPLLALLLIFPLKAEAAYDFGELGEDVNIGLDLPPDVENLAKWDADFIEGVSTSLAALMFGEDWNPDELLAYNPSPNQGLLGFSVRLVEGFYDNPPNLHTASFFRQMWAKSILGGPTYAATGAEYLKPIIELQLWQKFRDLSYLFLVVVLIAIGFMIMFRTKLDPRTTVTLTNALPSLVVSLVLITFSYPLAALTLDFGNVIKKLIDTVFEDIIGKAGRVDLGTVLRMAAGLFANLRLNLQVVAVIPFGDIISLIISIIFALLAFYVFFRLFIMLLMRWVGIIIQVIFAPLAFLAGAIPGKGEVAMGWFKGLVVNVLTFPVVYFLIDLALVIGQTGAPEFPVPEDLGLVREDFFIPGTSGNLNALVAFGILLMATKVPEFLEDAFEAAPSPHVARAGIEAKRIPIIGRLA